MAIQQIDIENVSGTISIDISAGFLQLTSWSVNLKREGATTWTTVKEYVYNEQEDPNQTVRLGTPEELDGARVALVFVIRRLNFEEEAYYEVGGSVRATSGTVGGGRLRADGHMNQDEVRHQLIGRFTRS